MTYSQPARAATPGVRIRRRRAVVLLAVVAVIAVALGARSPGSSTSPTGSTASSSTRAASPAGLPPGEPREALGTADGAVPDGTTVFDDDVPGVANLDPALLAALRQAGNAAAGDGVALGVDSGWRSRAYQAQLLREAIAKYGSVAEATRWVATPDTSAHVSGDAVDVGPTGAAAWLGDHGTAYGLCRIYGNEPWHFELRPQAVGHGCPPAYPDPTHDPRMHR